MSLLPSRGPDVSTAQEGEMQVVGVDEDVEPLLDALSSDTARAVLNEIYEEPGTPSQIADRLDMSIQSVSYHLDKLEEQDLIAVAGTKYSEKGQEMKVYEPPADPLVLFVGTQERKNSLKTMVKRLLPTLGILALGSLVVEQLFGRGGGFASPVSLGAEGGAADYSAEEAQAADDTGGSAGGESTDAAADATQQSTETAQETAAGGGDVSIQSAETATDAPATEAVTPAPELTGAERATEAFDAGAQATEAVAGGGGLSLSPGTAFFLGGLAVVVLLVALWTYRTYAKNPL